LISWAELLKSEVAATDATTAKLLEKVDPDRLDWKPASGNNWTTVGPLLKHISNACGAGCKGFVTRDWGCACRRSPLLTASSLDFLVEYPIRLLG